MYQPNIQVTVLKEVIILFYLFISLKTRKRQYPLTLLDCTVWVSGCAYPPILTLSFSHTHTLKKDVLKYILSVQCSWDDSEETKKSGKVRYHFHSVLNTYRAIFLKWP